MIQNRALRIAFLVKLEENSLMTTIQIQAESKCTDLDIRRDLHLLSYAYLLSKCENLVGNRNIPTRFHRGIRLLTPNSQKPIVIKSAFYQCL